MELDYISIKCQGILICRFRYLASTPPSLRALCGVPHRFRDESDVAPAAQRHAVRQEKYDTFRVEITTRLCSR